MRGPMLVRLSHSLKLAVALAGALALAHPAVAKNGSGPDSVADLVAPLMDAVVNISTEQTISGSRDAPLPDGQSDGDQSQGDNAPFPDLFDQFFGDKNGGDTTAPPQRVQSLGSGFVIDSSGIIVTNYHVIEDADEITANFNDGSKLPATLIGKDDKTDIAVIQVKPTKPLASLKFGNSALLRVGDWVMAIGNPFGLGGTVTVGILSARDRDINAGPYDDFLQTDAAINRGNSGGPLFNEDGEVIGINTAIISPTGGSIGLGFAIPSEIAVNVVNQLRQYGQMKRGWLGVHVQDVTDDIARDQNLPSTHGALVGGVETGGPAATAGIQTGDVILTVDGKTIQAIHDLPRIIAGEPVGKAVDVVILRKGVQQTISVTIGLLKEAADNSTGSDQTPPAKDSAKPDAPPDGGGSDQSAAPPDDSANPPPSSETTGPIPPPGPFGLSLADLSPEVRSQFDIKADIASGAVIVGVAPGSAAEEKQLEPGEVIAMVEDDPVSGADDFQSKLDALKKDGRVNARLVVRSRDDHVRWVNLPLSDSDK
ncbi:MAG TPA: Do family serine endopeptidase [Bauldia sp.]|nr:Do family serine endopeptidase [Bauldia sp.]